MKNITLSIDENVLAAVRLYAAEHNKTVNGLVRDYLTGIAEREQRARQARQRLRELSDHSSARIGAVKWRREDLYER